MITITFSEEKRREEEKCGNLILDFLNIINAKSIYDLADFDFFELLSFPNNEWKKYVFETEKPYSKTEFDPDNSKIARAIMFLIWNGLLPGLSFDGIGTGKDYRGDTICSYGNLLYKESLENHELIVNCDKSKVIQFQKKYLNIGNFYLLPNSTISLYSGKKETINTFRGFASGWHDYFDKFLLELKKCLEKENDTLLDKPNEYLYKLVTTGINQRYFRRFSTIESFININFLDDFVDDETCKLKSLFPENYSYRFDKNKKEYFEFVTRYIDFTEEMISHRAEKMITQLKRVLEL